MLELILVCFAVKEEAKFFRASSSSRFTIQTCLTGIGRKNAERALLQSLDQARPKLVLTCGFAGGLKPDWQCGDVLFEADPAAELDSILNNSGARRGLFQAASKVIVHSADKRRLGNETNADAVEMESEWIRQICRARAIPGATIRVILDTAAEDLPFDFNAWMTPGQKISTVKLLSQLARAPQRIPRLLRFQRQVQHAARRLGDVLNRFLEQY